MNNRHLKKTLQLIRRTGDKGIIIDEESDELFVLMDVNAYEKMLPTVPVPPNDHMDDARSEETPDDFALNDLIEAEGRQSQITAESVIPPKKVPPSPTVSGTEASTDVNFTENWPLQQVNILSEESLADVPHNGEEEEKFYLEPVE